MLLDSILYKWRDRSFRCDMDSDDHHIIATYHSPLGLYAFKNQVSLSCHGCLTRILSCLYALPLDMTGSVQMPDRSWFDTWFPKGDVGMPLSVPGADGLSGFSFRKQVLTVNLSQFLDDDVMYLAVRHNG